MWPKQNAYYLMYTGSVTLAVVFRGEDLLRPCAHTGFRRSFSVYNPRSLLKSYLSVLFCFHCKVDKLCCTLPRSKHCGGFFSLKESLQTLRLLLDDAEWAASEYKHNITC